MLMVILALNVSRDDCEVLLKEPKHAVINEGSANLYPPEILITREGFVLLGSPVGPPSLVRLRCWIVWRRLERLCPSYETWKTWFATAPSIHQECLCPL